MIKATPDQMRRFVNLFLRLCSLGAKLVLTLYMGRFFDLSSLGIYGLVLSAVVLSGTVLGQNSVYIVKREIVGLSPQDALVKIRDQVIWYVFNYALFGLVVLGLVASGATDIPVRYLVFIFILGVSESLGTLCYNNMNLLNQQVLAKFALFIRAALWVPVVLVLGFISPVFRDENTVLACWAAGSILGLFVPLWAWRHWGWAKMMKTPIDVAWLVGGIKKSAFIWLGTLGLMMGSYIDLYFVNHFIDLDSVGVLTFYYSFVNAINPLVESGAMTFAAPKLVDLHKKNDSAAFWREVAQTGKQVGIGVAIAIIALGLFVPWLASFLGKPAFIEEVGTFWMLLGAAWICSMGLVAYYILFAQHRDKPIWVGNALFLIPVFACNAIFIPTFGFSEVGYSALVSSILLLLWRGWFVQWPKGFFRIP